METSAAVVDEASDASISCSVQVLASPVSQASPSGAVAAVILGVRGTLQLYLFLLLSFMMYCSTLSCINFFPGIPYIYPGASLLEP